MSSRIYFPAIYIKTCILLAFVCLLSLHSNAQDGHIYGRGRNIHMRYYDYKRGLHFGFTLGTNVSNFKYTLSKEWYKQDTVNQVHVEKLPGITLGAVANLHIGEYFDIRFIPTLILIQRNIQYQFADGTKPVKQVESALGEFPLLLKFKSERYDNFRFYIIGGFKYSYDFSSDEKAKKNPANPIVALRTNSYAAEYGLGLDFYLQYFKFSPEIKLSKGINNVLSPDAQIYSRIFDGFRSNIVYISLYFEG